MNIKQIALIIVLPAIFLIVALLQGLWLNTIEPPIFWIPAILIVFLSILQVLLQTSKLIKNSSVIFLAIKYAIAVLIILFIAIMALAGGFTGKLSPETITTAIVNFVAIGVIVLLFILELRLTLKLNA